MELQPSLKITLETTIHDLASLPCLSAALPYLIYGVKHGPTLQSGASLKKLCDDAVWDLGTLKLGLERLMENAARGTYLYPVYSPAEIADEPEKAHVNVIHFPPTADRGEKPFVIIAAGGAFLDVCSLGEAYPLSAQLNALGYHTFALTYRVGGMGLFPRPMEDLAAALRYLLSHREAFGLRSECYIVAGFSAGGTLTALWGTANHGCRAYGLPKPAALFPIYPAVSSSLFFPGEGAQAFCRTMWGENYTPETAREYDVLLHVDADYPPCYINCCKDDPLVPWQNGAALAAKLQEQGIPVLLKVGEYGGHGYSIGLGTDVEGWVSAATAFVEHL